MRLLRQHAWRPAHAAWVPPRRRLAWHPFHRAPGFKNCNERQNWTGTAARQAAVATCTLAVLRAGDMAWCVSHCQMLTAVSSLKGGMLVVDAFIMAKLRLLVQRKC